MRTLRKPLLFALLLALTLPPVQASAQGSAACAVPFQVTRDQQLGSGMLTPGPYKLTVIDSSELSCDEAAGTFRDALRERGAALPDGWKFDATTRTLSREDGSDAMRIDPDTDVGPISEDDSIWDKMESFALTWLPVIFMGLIAVAVVWMIRYMPRTKPQEIAPASASSVCWEDVAGVEEAKEELREVVEFMRDPK